MNSDGDKELKYSNTDTVRMFWTGGWDSTFRLLQLLLIEKVTVQPYYLIDESRSSTYLEIESMDHIVKYLFDDYPHTQNLLLPVKFFNTRSFMHDLEISNAWSEINKRQHIGGQFKLLACFCKQYRMSGIELSIESNIPENRSEDTISYILSKSELSSIESALFKYYTFPLLNITKKDMLSEVKEKGWMDIMNLTWTCHHPIHIPFHKTVPCGGCNPCTTAIEEGLGFRIPLYSRLLGKHVKKLYNIGFIKKIFRLKMQLT